MQTEAKSAREAAFAAVDWGTSSFRLWLIDGAGTVVAERRSHEGMTVAREAGFADVLSAHIAAAGASADLPVVVCGMAGARKAWHEAGYIDVPASLGDVAERSVRVPDQPRDIRILPGIAQRFADAPDVMRGEETQLLGLADGAESVSAPVCMPGTHSKWVNLVGGTVTGFSTFMTGELFEAVTKATILSLTVEQDPAGADPQTFQAAVAEAFANPALTSNLLFRIRAGALLFEGAQPAARERVSGILIGLELAAALQSRAMQHGVVLVASGRLASVYSSAFEVLSVPVRTVDADTAVIRGLTAAARSIWSI